MAKVKYRSPSDAMMRIAGPRESVDEGTVRKSVGLEDQVCEYYNISVDNLVPFHHQARKKFDEDKLKALADTIRAHGIRQPLTVISQPNNQGVFEVVSGDRRLRAAKLVGLEKVPCIIINDMKDAEEVSLIENLQREDLSPVEIAEAYQELLNCGVCDSVTQISEKLGVSRTSVSEHLNIMKLPIGVKFKLSEIGDFSRDLVRELIKCPDELAMLNLLDGSSPTSPRSVKLPYLNTTVLKVVLRGDKLFFNKNSLPRIPQQHKPTFREELQKIIDLL